MEKTEPRRLDCSLNHALDTLTVFDWDKVLPGTILRAVEDEAGNLVLERLLKE